MQAHNPWSRSVLTPLKLFVLTMLSAIAGCGGGGGNSASAALAPAAATPPVAATAAAPAAAPAANAMDTTLRELIEANRLTDDAASNRTVPAIDDPLPQLGKKLFFSKSLGGDMDVACVSCHHPLLGGSDTLSLPVGIGAVNPDVLGTGRTQATTGLPNVPRNSPTVFNAGLHDGGMFWDSRVESFGKEPDANGARSDIRTPDVAPGTADAGAGEFLPTAQARFPVTSIAEMRGDVIEAGAGSDAVRTHLAARIGGYGVGADELSTNTWLVEFRSAFGQGTAEQLITFDRIAEALAAYERSMVFTNNRFRDYVSGNLTALSAAEKRGAILFFTEQANGGGGCANCHSGDAFTDELHHTVAFVQFGPGKGDGNDDDFGRSRETGDAADQYRYRTPSLLNVEVTAPYGHAGAYQTLPQVLAHYNNPDGTVDNFFDQGGACSLPQFANVAGCAALYPASRDNSAAALRKLQRERNAGSSEFPATNLNNNERNDIVAFLTSLTDPCVRSRVCLTPWIANPTDAGPDGQQLNARDASGNLL